MADKQISALPEATSIGLEDLFVTQQNNQAKKVTGQTLVSELANALDGHGGIASIELDSTVGVVKTYTITFADGTTFDYEVSDGERGYTGAQTYVHIRYAAEYPVTTILTTPNKYIGIYAGTLSTAPSGVADYTWYEWKGAKGDTGVSIVSITKGTSSGNTDTYIVTFSNQTTTTFTVTNGSNIQGISKTSSSGLVDTYTVTLTDGTTTSFQVSNAKSITSITLVSGNHSAGQFDVYRVLFNDGDTFDFQVYNGANGTGAVSSVAGIPVVGEQGDVPLVVLTTTVPTTSTVGYINQFRYCTTNGVMYICVDDTGGTYTWRGTTVTIDSVLSSTSTNPVQNAVIYAALNGKVPTTRTINGNALSSDITLTAASLGAVPTTRTINGTTLANNIVTRLFFNNVSVATSAWVSDSTYTDYAYKAVISLNGVTADMFPEVVFLPDDVASGNFAPVVVSAAGSVTIYAKAVPSSAVTIPSIVCFA